MYQQYKEGWLEVISGCMFAGKTEELIHRIKALEYAEEKIAVFKPKIDDRYSGECIVSHCGGTAKNFVINRVHETFGYIDDSYDVVAIDEIRFFDEEIVEICDYFADHGKRVVVAGLDMDFCGEPLGVMPQLFIYAEFVTKLTAVCTICEASATRSQWLTDGRAARYDDPIILVGASEQYEARCRHCREVPRKPLIHKQTEIYLKWIYRIGYICFF